MAFVASSTASSSRSDDDAMSGASRRRRDKEIDAVPPPPFGLMGVAGDLCVARRRRCPCIAFSLLLDLTCKPHQRTSPYLSSEALNVPYSTPAVLSVARLVRTASSTPRYENLCIIPAKLMGVAGDLCVARRRRCSCIAFSLLLDLTSQAPSANVTVFPGRDTRCSVAGRA